MVHLSYTCSPAQVIVYVVDTAYANYNTTILNGDYMLKQIFIFLTFLGLFPLAAQAVVYKWVDEDGKVNYSQQKPPNTKTEKVKVSTRKPDDSSTYKKPSLKSKEDDKKASDASAKNGNKSSSKPERSAKEMADICKQSQAALQAMQSAGRVRQKDDKGNVTYMSEEQKQQRIKREQDRVKENCK